MPKVFALHNGTQVVAKVGNDTIYFNSSLLSKEDALALGHWLLAVTQPEVFDPEGKYADFRPADPDWE